jgi:hypothetical protein
MTPMAESPDLVAGKRLLDIAKHNGFQFQRVTPGPDGPLRGVRETEEWRDTIYLAGFWGRYPAPPPADGLLTGHDLLRGVREDLGRQ